MARISYLCNDCSKLLGMTGFDAVNEVGRKNCEGCGGNDDNLVVVDAYEAMFKISEYNLKNQEGLTK